MLQRRSGTPRDWGWDSKGAIVGTFRANRNPQLSGPTRPRSAGKTWCAIIQEESRCERTNPGWLSVVGFDYGNSVDFAGDQEKTVENDWSKDR
jgi:hypothetical protein